MDSTAAAIADPAAVKAVPVDAADDRVAADRPEGARAVAVVAAAEGRATDQAVAAAAIAGPETNKN